MAVPIGTSSKQLAAISRWALAFVVFFGMLTWWRPSYRTWGTLSGSLLVIFALWITWRILDRDRTAPGHAFHLVLLGPAVILLGHAIHRGLLQTLPVPESLAGALDMSLLFQVWLLWLGVLLIASLLPDVFLHPILLAVCGLMMAAGSAAALVWGYAIVDREPIALLGYCGVAVWLSMLWRARDGEPNRLGLRKRPIRLLFIFVAGIGSGILASRSPVAAVLALSAGGIAIVLCTAAFLRRAWLLALAALVSVGLVITAVILAIFRLPSNPGWLGSGELAFDQMSPSFVFGVRIVAGTTGWVGLLWLSVGAVGCLLWLVFQAGKGPRENLGGVICWTAAVLLASFALICPGGFFIPSVTLAMALAWGLFPSVAGVAFKPRSGLWTAIVVGMMMMMMALVCRTGLPGWSVESFGFDDRLHHFLGGFFLAMVAVWIIAPGRTWVGVVVIVVSGLFGGLAEVIQHLVSVRSFDLRDWLWHAIGTTAALVPYLLARGAVLCESVHAVTSKQMRTAAERYGP